MLNTIIEFMDAADHSSRLFTGLIHNLNRFCSKVPELVYCRVMREFSLHHEDREGSPFSWVILLHFLMIEWYKRGMQSLGWENRRVSLSSAVDITLLEMFVLMIDFQPEREGFFPIRDKDVKAVKSLLRLLNGDITVEVCLAFLRFLDSHDLLTKFVFKSSYEAFTTVFSDKRQPNYCVQFSSIYWTGGDFKIAGTFLSAILNKVGADVLQYRRVLLNSKGVTLQLRKPLGIICEVTLQKIHKEEFHYFYVCYKIVQGMYRNLVLNIEDLEINFLTLLYEVDYQLIIGILCWLGLQISLLQGVDSLGEPYQPVKEGLKQWIQDIAACFEEENIIYVTPTWWNYE